MNVCFNSEVAVEDEETIEYEGSACSENSGCLTSYLPEKPESYENGTKLALSGGVTTVIESPSLLHRKNSLQDYSNTLSSLKDLRLYCDIGFLASINNENLCEIPKFAEAGALGFKAYIIPPAFEVPYLSLDCLEKALAVLEKLNKPLFIHPESANERYIYMSSPFRNETLISRKYKPEPSFVAFQGAFPDEIEGSSSEISPISSKNSTPMKNTPLSANRTKIDEKVLERQIHYQFNNLETLIKAEIMSYSASGFTVFEPESPIPTIPDISAFEIVLDRPVLFKVNSPIKATLMPNNSRRPPPITCSKLSSKKSVPDYKSYLANCPPH